MSKIRLSILLLTSFVIFSCTTNLVNHSSQKYSLAYIDGKFDGLLLKNNLISSLKELNIYDQNSKFEIQANINHSSKLFITNINNTSDREKIITKLSFQIVNKISNCQVYRDQIIVSQFYIYASSDKFLSNKSALKKIKKYNTESAVKKLLYKLNYVNDKCDEK